MGRIEALLLSSRRLLAGLAQDVDAGTPVGAVGAVDGGLLKAVVMRNAVDAEQEALALTSNHGLSRRNPLERHLRDVLCGRVHTPQDDSVHVAAGRVALNL
ncbi:acyl-CoA dehydrogenase [Alicycliphilus sp. B1]|nr:acyl-CoA dehydrogenase [Alicycliphilus sp. B1]GAO22841.1 acyl-CoA dehydrogenase [Alicycliphilus sp. B1]